MTTAKPAQDKRFEPWNDTAAAPFPARPVHVHDETLRDGLQSPSVTQPDIGQRLELLHMMEHLRIESADLGMPVSGPTSRAHVRRLAEEIAACRLALSPTCAARTMPADVAAVADIAQATGVAIVVMAFVGISPARLDAEQWEIEQVIGDVAKVVAFARKEGLPVCIVTEDTSRSRRDVAVKVYRAALDAGAERICICDTVGYAAPWGAAAVVRDIREGLAECGYPGVGIDWHGHNDRGLALANSLAAAGAGADRLHGTALGIGERAGNTSMEQLLVNLRELGWREHELNMLPRYCDTAARACELRVPDNQPFIGADAYRTGTGVHAAAIRKALAVGDTWLAERVYAGIPASLLGLEQRIEVGPASGRANILHWLDTNGISATPEILETLRQAVEATTRVLPDDELRALVSGLIPAERQQEAHVTP